MVIGITMYSESWHELNSTMSGIFENLNELYESIYPEEAEQKKQKNWDKFSENFIVVLI